MKSILFASCFCFLFGQVIAQCPEDATAGDVQTPSLGSYIIGVSNSDDFSVDLSQQTVGWQGTENYALIMTFPANELGQEIIAEVSLDGSFDLSAYEAASYTFTGFGYNQYELDEVTNNTILRNLLNIDLLVPCVVPDMGFDEFIACIVDKPFFLDTNALTIESYVSVWGGPVEDVLGFQPCLTVEENRHTIEVVDAASGLEDLNDFHGIETVNSFPNPTTGLTTIEINSHRPGEALFTVFDQRGSVALQLPMKLNSGSNERQVDLSSLPDGLYLYQLSAAGISRSSKIQISR